MTEGSLRPEDPCRSPRPLTNPPKFPRTDDQLRQVDMYLDVDVVMDADVVAVVCLHAPETREVPTT